jgi:DNA topoisomerase-3
LTLIIAEKPMLAACIADAIDGPEKKLENGYITKGDYTIISAYGHLLTLKEPRDYDPQLSKWKKETLPIFFNNWEQKPKEDGKGQGTSTLKRLNQIGELLKKARIVIHAGDPDEEGQLLIDEILRWFKYNGPVKRLQTADTTREALKKALTNLEDNKAWENAGWSAYARSVADMIVGVNLTRYFSINNYPAKLTVGRVQSPTLGLVVNRDYQIENHIKLRYYVITSEIDIEGRTVHAKYEPAEDDQKIVDGKISDELYAKSKVDMLRNETLRGITITRNEKLEQPPLPFNFDELQYYCGKKFGYTPAETMEITQSLRDNYRAITYNRSDCRYLSESQYAEAPATMETVIQNISYKPKQLNMAIKSKCFNNENITAHTAIIPQNVRVDLSKLTEQEKNVYLAICKYYMIQFLPPARKAHTRLEVNLNEGGRLIGTSVQVLEKGYLALFKNDEKTNEEECNALSDLIPGTYQGYVKDVSLEAKETKPASRYTQSSLMKDMSRISKYVDNPEIKKLLLEKDKDKKGENGSIGTTATRPSIIENLIARGFLEEKGKVLISTPLGRELYRILPDEVKKADMTARWWVFQEDIKNWKAGCEKLIDNVLEMVTRIIHTTYPTIDSKYLPAGRKCNEDPTSQNANIVGECPRCNRPVIEREKEYRCAGWKEGCRFVIWKQPSHPTFRNIKFSKKDASAFLSNKPVKKKNLTKKDGTKFEAYIVLLDNPQSPYGVEYKLQRDKVVNA